MMKVNPWVEVRSLDSYAIAGLALHEPCADSRSAPMASPGPVALGTFHCCAKLWTTIAQVMEVPKSKNPMALSKGHWIGTADEQ